MPAIFDFDGVLADSEPVHAAAFHDVVDAIGWTFTHEQFKAEFVGKSDLVCLRMLAQWHDDPRSEEELLELRRQKTDAFQARVRAGEVLPFPGSIELFKAAAEGAGGVIAVCSGSIDGIVRPVLERFGLLPLVRSLATADRVPAPKPDPTSYLLAAREIGADPAECVAVEDSPTGIRAAKAAGIRCLAVAHSFPPETLTEADEVYEKIADIPPEALLGAGIRR